MKAWRVQRHGRPSTALDLDEVERPEPGPGEVVVRAHSSALNYNEIDGCHGRYITIDPPLPYTLGMEVLGTVTAAGVGGESWLGRRVVATGKGATGAYAEYVVAPLDMVFDAPPTLDDVAGAAFFFPFHLAWLGLHERGRLSFGETVLVHAGAGGVSSAAIQLARAAGARVLATAGGPEKVAFCRSLGAEGIDYRADDFVASVAELTDGRGVDLVFDTVGGDVAVQSVAALARNGRLMMIGFAGGIEAEDQPMMPPRALMFGNVSIGGVLLSYSNHAEMAREHAGYNVVPRSVGETIHAELLTMIEQGSIAPIVGRVVDFAELPQALEDMEDRRTIGRVVVVHPDVADISGSANLGRSGSTSAEEAS